MEKLLKVLGLTEHENFGESISGKAFERLFYEIIQLHNEFLEFEISWPVVTPAGAKTFRNQAIKILTSNNLSLVD